MSTLSRHRPARLPSHLPRAVGARQPGVRRRDGLRGLAAAGACFLAGLPAAAGPALAETGPNAAGLRILQTTGIELDRIRSLGADPLVVELDVDDASRQAAFAGLIRIDRDPLAPFAAQPVSTAPPLTMPERFGYWTPSAGASGTGSDDIESNDLAGLELAPDDYELLKECRPGDCRFKLDAEKIAAVQRMDWSRSDARQRFLEWFRPALGDDVSRYRALGLDGLVTYADKPEPFPVARGVRQLQQATAPLLDLYPGIRDYLGAYPAPAPEGVSDRFVWTLSDVGYRPTLSVDHLVVGEGNAEHGLDSAMVLRTLYASHYLAGRLQLAAVVDGAKVFGVPGHFLLTLDRILFDDEVGGFKRLLLGRGLGSNMNERLERVRRRTAVRS